MDSLGRSSLQKPPANPAPHPAVIWLCFVLISVSPGLRGQTASEAETHIAQGQRLARSGDFKSAEAEFRRAVELSPKDPACLASLAGVLASQKRLDEASTYFERALKLDPGDALIRRNLAATQWQSGRFEEAKGNLEQILKTNPRDKPTIFLLGMVEENLRNYRRARELLSSVPGLVNERPESIAALARSYYQTGEKQQARKSLEGLKEHPAGPRAAFLGGKVAAEAGDFQTAEELLTSIRATYPDKTTLGYTLALVQYRTERFSECRRTLLDLISKGNVSGEIYSLLGWSYAKQDRVKEAIGVFEQAIQLDPSNESTYLDLGSILIDHKMTGPAIDLAKRAVERLPESYRAHMMQGMLEAYIGLLTDAVKSYAQAVRLGPNSPEANYDLAMVQSVAGFTPAARETLERGIERFPRDALHYEAYASFLVDLADAGDVAAESRAISMLKVAISLDSSLSELHYLLGKLALKRGSAAEAMRELELAAKLDPRIGKIHLALSRTYHRLGREEASANELRVYEECAKEELKAGRERTAVKLRRW